MFTAWYELRLLPKELWILFFSTLINRMGTMVLPFLVLYLTQDQGFKPSTAGTVLTAYGASAFVSGIIAGKLSDRFGSLIMMQLSLALTSVGLFLFPFIKNLSSIVWMTCILAMVSEVYQPANLSLISSTASQEQRKAAFALHRLAINLGMSIGPALGGFLIGYSFRLLFIIDGLSTLSAAIILILYTRSFKHSTPVTSTPWPDLSSRMPKIALSDPCLRYFLLALFPVSVVFYQYEAALPLYLVSELKLPEIIYGFLFTVNTCLIVALEIPINHRTRHWTYRKTLALGSIFFAFGFGSLVFARTSFETCLTVAIWTIGEMILFPSMSTYISEISPAHRRGEYMSYYGMISNLAFMTGPWLGTLVFQHFGSRILWIITFILGMVSAALFFRLQEHSGTKKI